MLCHSILYLCSISLTGQRSVGEVKLLKKPLKPSRNPQSLWKPDIVFGLNILPDQDKLPANQIFGMKRNINFKAWRQASCLSQMPLLTVVAPPFPAPLTSGEHQSPTPQAPSVGELFFCNAVLWTYKHPLSDPGDGCAQPKLLKMTYSADVTGNYSCVSELGLWWKALLDKGLSSWCF